MNADTPGSRRQFFATMLAGALCAGTAALATLGSAGARRSHAKPDDGNEPRGEASTSESVLAAMNDLSGILEP